MNDKDEMTLQRSRMMFLNASSGPRVLDFLWRVQVWRVPIFTGSTENP